MTARRSTGGLLAVHAHPDDETLFTGGLLATWALLGRPAMVVTCTRGERGEVIPPELKHLEGAPLAMAAHREQELAGALAALGVTDHCFLDELTEPGLAGVLEPPATEATVFRDSGMAWLSDRQAGRAAELPPDAFVAVSVERAAYRLAALIRERRPDVVVTYEPGGGYGHPDHVHAHLVTMRAVELAADEGVEMRATHAGGPHAGADHAASDAQAPFRVPLLVWAAASEPIVRAALAVLPELSWVKALMVADERLRSVDPLGALPSMTVPAAELDYSVDVSEVSGAVASAMRAHASQIHAIATAPGRTEEFEGAAIAGCYALADHVLVPVFDREWYRAAPTWRPAPGADLSAQTSRVA